MGELRLAGGGLSLVANAETMAALLVIPSLAPCTWLAIHRSLAIHLVELRAQIGNGQFVMRELRGNPLGHFRTR
jgi:hypothetical protein